MVTKFCGCFIVINKVNIKMKGSLFDGTTYKVLHSSDCH